MKALKYFASALALVALFTSCEEEDKYVQAELPTTMEAYFPATTMTVSMEELTTGFDVEIARVNYDEAATATLTCTQPTGVNVPSTVSFAAGQEKTQFTVSVDQAAVGQGKTLSIELYVDTESKSPYANQRCVINLTTWSPEPPVTWEPIETEAVFRHNIIGMAFSTKEVSYDVYVEKRTDCEMYRIANAFTYFEKDGKEYHFPYYASGDETVPLDPVTWTIVDCSGQLVQQEVGKTIAKNAVWFPMQSTNNNWGYGDMVFCSLAYNLSTSAGPCTPESNPIGIYNPETKQIAFGQLGLNLADYGWFADQSTDPKGWATLYLDKNLMGTDFERDCAFSKLQDATLKSSILGDKWTVALHEGAPADEKKAEEYAEQFGQVIKVENAYVEGFPVYFCVDAEGKISVPEEYAYQAMGLSIAGFDLYLNIKKGEFANNSYSLLCEMVGADPAGVKADILYGEYTEVIDAETIGTASSIDEFVGDYVMVGETFEFNSQGQMTGNLIPFEIPVSMVKADDTTIKMTGVAAGALGSTYDDSLVWTFNGGYLQFTPQDMPDLTAGSNVYDVFATLCTSAGNLWNKSAAGVIFFDAGISSTGSIKFFNDPGNAQYNVEAEGFGIFGIVGGSYTIMADPCFNASMTPASDDARVEYVTKARFAPVTGKVITELTRKSGEREYFVNGQKATAKTNNRQLVGVRTDFVTL